MTDQHDTQAVRDYLLRLQESVGAFLSGQDPGLQRREDRWERQQGGGGCTRVFSNGALFEHAAVNFSHVRGERLPESAVAGHPALADCGFEALGVSVIIHPLNPYVPTTHMNVRFFVAGADRPEVTWWFGGGFDLSPYYAFAEDVRHWHRTAHAACVPFGADVYPRYKRWCDEYFFLPHRNEPRGVGGLFYDALCSGGFAHNFAFTRSVGDHFLVAYRPIVERRKGLPWGERERWFQGYRRGRYVEFNLVYDRGTLFGLQSGGRTESILASLPPQVSWRYDWHPEPGSPEAELYEKYLPVRDWLEE